MTNIALVVLDTVRKDAFDDFFDWVPGIRFENAWSTANYTIPSHASMFTGKYSSEIGVHAKSETLDCDQSVLAEHLRDTGYQTRAVSGNILASTINKFDRGFEEFYFTGRAKTLSDEVYPWIQKGSEASRNGFLRDISLIYSCIKSEYDIRKSIKCGWEMKRGKYSSIDDTVRIISELEFGENEFLFINLMDAHAPYQPPKDYRSTTYDWKPIHEGITIENESELNDQKQAYRDVVSYLSDRYRVLFDSLKSSFDYIITVSDHGELFGEYGTSKHPYGVFPEITRVPISIYSGKDIINRVTQTTSLIDIYQTVLNLSGINASGRGRDLLNSTSEVNYLTESLGLRSSQLESLNSAGINPELIQMIDQPLRGIAMDDDYYGYETPEGNYIEQGTPVISNPREKFEELVNDLDFGDKSKKPGMNKGIREDVQEQLRNLGYM